MSCSSVFTTEEVPKLSDAWRIKNKYDQYDSFSRDKLVLSLYKSCSHRKNAVSDAGSIADTVISKLQTEINAGVIEAKLIKQVVIIALNRFDKAASVHYQAFHSS